MIDFAATIALKQKERKKKLIINIFFHCPQKQLFTNLFFFAAYYRFVVLFFNCLLSFGSYFSYDIPSVLQAQFQGVSKTKQQPVET